MDEKMKVAEKPDLNLCPPPGLGVRHLQILMMTLCATVVYVIRSSMGAAILAMTDVSHVNNTYVEIYEWSEEIRGVILSSFFWGYTTMQIPAGILCKHFGGKPLLLMALISNGVLALATPMLAKFGSWIAVCLVRVCTGLTQACFMPGEHTLLGQWAPPQERNRLSILAYAGIQIGTILTMPICGILSNTSLGWAMIFYTMGGLSLATAVLWWGLTANTPRQHRFIKEPELQYIEQSLSSKEEEHHPIPWRHILTSMPLLGIAAAHIGVNWCFTIFLVQIPGYLKNALDINLTDSAMLSSLPFLAQWISSTCCSILGDFLSNRKLLSITSSRKMFNTISAVGSCCGLLVMSFLTSANKTAAVVVLIATVGLLGAATCGFMLNHIDLSPRFGGVMLALTNCVANLIGLFAPLSTGYILGDNPTDISRWRIVFYMAAGIILVSDVVYRLLATSELQHWNDLHSTKYENGCEKKLSLKSDALEGKEEKMYSFSENVANE